MPIGMNTRTMTLAEQIAERIAESIISGQYRPGQKVSEQELATLFSVSRGPIREALRILENESFVRILPRRFTQVATLTPKEVEDIFGVRASLLCLAAQLVTANLTEESMREFQWSIGEVQRLAESGDVGNFLRLVYRLSAYLAESSGNLKLEAMIRSMSRQTLALTHAVLNVPENRRRWAENWQRLARCIVDENAESACAAARELVNETGNWVRKEAERMAMDGTGDD